MADRVLVKRVSAQAQTAGGVYLSDVKTPNEGEVVSVGPGIRVATGDFIETTLKAGDKVLLPEYGGTKVEEDLVLFREDDILGKYE